MKKLALIIGIALLFLSCEKDDNDCKCPRARFTTFGNVTGSFYIQNLPIDCSTKKPDMSKLPSGYIYLGCEN
jgi:hypothetical protein